MKPLSNVILICFIAGPLFAQTQKGQSFQDIQQEMLEMQRRFLQQFEQLSPGNQAFTLPEGSWDTTFTFRFDTTIDGQHIGSSFFFSPFGQDTTFMRGFGDNPFRDGLNPFGDMFQWSFPPRSGFPQNEENSALGDPGDGLLPEERLRQEQEGAGDKPMEKEPPKPAKKPKSKTFQI